LWIFAILKFKMSDGEKLPPTILVIFGITGDLSHRYLLPALYQLCRSGQLLKDFKIVGVSRREIIVDGLYNKGEESLKQYTVPFQMDLESPESYQSLKAKISEIKNNFSSEPEVIYYLSVPPAGVLQIIRHLGESGLNSKNSKLLLEKPFGVDLESASNLIDETQKYFPQEQVYRIDHYLVKETAQNIVVFLGSNSLFRNVWSNTFIEKIEIDAAEQIGVEGRANFYDATGALRDFVQSHLLQLSALTLMEPCSELFEFSELPERRLGALKKLKADITNVVHGQYKGYQDEVENPGSKTETFVSLVLESEDPRWQGVPIRIATGKKLKEKLTEIRVYFKKTEGSEENLLILRIQPREGIELQLKVKQPGYERRLQKLPLEFTYEQYFKELPAAYEQVLVDAIRSNHSLFASSEEVLASWEILQPIQSRWAMDTDGLVIYEPGSTVSDILNNN
jgi:glucose-6-phosphate 1-dehydrogenase